MICLPDVNVWIAMAVDCHPHHLPARRWMEEFEGERLAFCRITEMGLLRLLTNPKVMDGAPLTAANAWRVLDAFRDDMRIAFLKEPAGFEQHWRESTRSGVTGPNFWTDAYLASLCNATGCTLVTFDRALARRKGVDTRLLEGDA
jgi:toxin-antitoxin system PIN domain toxin